MAGKPSFWLPYFILFINSFRQLYSFSFLFGNLYLQMIAKKLSGLLFVGKIARARCHWFVSLFSLLGN